VAPEEYAQDLERIRAQGEKKQGEALMPQVQVNKWVRFALTFLTGALGLLAAYNWTDLVDAKTAGLIIIAISAVKGVIDVIAPGAGVPTVPTGTPTSLVTHTATSSRII
jgi:hypothetical protein